MNTDACPFQAFVTFINMKQSVDTEKQAQLLASGTSKAKGEEGDSQGPPINQETSAACVCVVSVH